MIDTLSSIESQLSSLRAIHSVEELDASLLDSGREVSEALMKIWPDAIGVQTVPRRVSRAAIKNQSPDELQEIVTAIRRSIASIHVAEAKSGKAHNATLQRLAQHSAFKLPSETAPHIQVTPVAIEGESASEMLLRERR